MKKQIALYLFAFALLTQISSCQNASTNDGSANSLMGKECLVADTIFYPVRIKNIDPNDEWADNRLRKLDRKRLVDQLFESVYSGKSTPYNYLTDATMTIDDIRQMEQREEFSRDNVVELEFREKWWYDAQESRFEKQVLSVLVAYAVFEDDGSLRGMKAAFYVKNRSEK
jgi:hypothetical protein